MDLEKLTLDLEDLKLKKIILEDLLESSILTNVLNLYPNLQQLTNKTNEILEKPRSEEVDKEIINLIKEMQEEVTNVVDKNSYMSSYDMKVLNKDKEYLVVEGINIFDKLTEALKKHTLKIKITFKLDNFRPVYI